MRAFTTSFAAFFALAALAGCGTTAQPPQLASGPLQATTAGSAFAATVRTDVHVAAPQMTRSERTRSWMSPDAKNQKQLLYISDVNANAVFVYGYPKQKKLLGKLAFFEYPYGLCSDKAGHVYVSDFGRARVYEYAHGGSTPINILSAVGSPIGCSVDAQTGNLAVASFNGVTPSTSAGGVWIFPKGSNTPTLYQGSSFLSYWPPGYDDKGNLFVEYATASTTGLAEIATGASGFTNISLNATISFPAGVAWDGKYLAVTDQGYQGQKATAIYRVAIAGSAGSVVDTLTLDPGASCGNVDVVQPFIELGRRVIAGNPDCPAVNYWNYPAGGAPTATYAGPPFGFPLGQTISTKG